MLQSMKRELTKKPFLILALPLLALAACQTGAPSSAVSINTKQEPRSMVVSLAKNAQTCWFKSNDNAFKSFRLAAEVNSHAGRPRFLLVPKNNPGGLPSLVVQAEAKGDTASGKFTNIQTFGPLLSSSDGQRIATDIKRWTTGNKSCA